MLRKIIETIGTRYLIAILNLILLFINARTLGAAGVGVIGLVVASANIVMMCNSVLSGNTIVYFMNRHPFLLVFLPAYIWTFLAGGVACVVLWGTGLIPEGYVMHVYVLSVLFSLSAANARFLLGYDRMRGFNLTYTLQGGLLFIAVLLLYYGLEIKSVDAYLWGLYFAYGSAWFVSLILLLPSFKPVPMKTLPKLTGKMLQYGLWAGVDNLAEQFTSRVNYFLIQSFSGLGSVGLLDAGTKVSESIWNISRSVSFIAYGNVAKTDDAAIQKRITIQLGKLTFAATFTAMALVLLIPEFVYTSWLFGEEFKGIRTVILCLSPGVVALACNSILSHFFIGTGRIRTSAACSLIGLLVLLGTGSFLIPLLGVIGAAISGSIAFVSMLTFSTVLFCRTSGAHLRDFLFTADDRSYLREKTQIFLSGFKHS